MGGEVKKIKGCSTGWEAGVHASRGNKITSQITVAHHSLGGDTKHLLDHGAAGEAIQKKYLHFDIQTKYLPSRHHLSYFYLVLICPTTYL